MATTDSATDSTTGSTADQPTAQPACPWPTLRRYDGGAHLCVNGRPRLLLGGQLHNSTPSDPTATAEAMDLIRDLGGNLVIGSASWHLVEPEEGVFDFHLVDAQVEAARRRGLHLVLIWFGAFKNAASTYAPRWVRADTARFPRVVRGGDEVGPVAFEQVGAKPVLSVFSTQLVDADRRALVALSTHLARTDGDHTVVMVQVENETGLLGSARDHGPAAQEAWDGEVPEDLTTYLAAHEASLHPSLRELWVARGRRRTGTWAQVLGEDWRAEEVFQAWHTARYVEALASASRDVLPVPHYTNAWLGPQPGQDRAGQYPSGGPASTVIDVWKVAAPSLDLLGPDIYVDDAKAAVAGYRRGDNPLFVPESRIRTGSLLWALGQGAFGFSVFGIDDARRGSQLSCAFVLLGSMEGQVLAAQREGRLTGVLLEAGETATVVLDGGVRLELAGSRDTLARMFLDAGVEVVLDPPAREPETVRGAVPAAADARAMGLVLDEGEGRFLLLGQGLMVSACDVQGNPVEVDDVWEGTFVDGTWVPGRNLNGDERLEIVPMDELGLARVRLLC